MMNIGEGSIVKIIGNHNKHSFKIGEEVTIVDYHTDYSGVVDYEYYNRCANSKGRVSCVLDMDMELAFKPKLHILPDSLFEVE